MRIHSFISNDSAAHRIAAVDEKSAPVSWQRQANGTATGVNHVIKHGRGIRKLLEFVCCRLKELSCIYITCPSPRCLDATPVFLSNSPRVSSSSPGSAAAAATTTAAAHLPVWHSLPICALHARNRWLFEVIAAPFYYPSAQLKINRMAF